jgi:integrase
MPKRAITQLFLDRITPPRPDAKGRPTRVEFWDTHQRGLGLRLSSTGARSWVVMYWVKGKQVRETLGTLAAIPEVAEARRRALASMEQARKGVNPVAERRVTAERIAANTIGAAVERWLDHCTRNLRASTVRGYRQLFNHDVLPRWASRPLAEITKGDVLMLLDDKAGHRERTRKGLTEGAGVQANRLLTRLRTFFGWCIANDLITADPTAGVRKPAREAARDRVLSDDELRAFWIATAGTGAPRSDAVPWGALVRLLLLTGQRAGEVAGMRWSEIDLEAKEWTIPAARSKNGKPHTVALSAAALEVLAGVPRAAGRDLVFSGNGTTPASGFSRAKRQLDAAMTSMPDWVIHDLRRTAATGMARLGIAPHVADRVLNHTQGTIRGVAAVYNRFEYLDERRNALEAWGGFVARLVAPGGTDNVVPLRA